MGSDFNIGSLICQLYDTNGHPLGEPFKMNHITIFKESHYEPNTVAEHDITIKGELDIEFALKNPTILTATIKSRYRWHDGSVIE